jgi:hypothetical protein
MMPCFDLFEGSSSVVEPARFRVPVGAAPFQAMIYIQVKSVRDIFSIIGITHEHPGRLFP